MKADSSFVFLDVESLPAEKTSPLWQRLSSQIQPNPEESKQDFDSRVGKILKNTAMNPALGRVWMIGVAFRSETPVIFSGDGTPESEVHVLEELDGFLSNIQNPWLVGYNIESFDIPFLKVRCLHHGKPKIAAKLGRYSTKPWDAAIVDLMKVWPRTGADKSAWETGLKGLGKLDTVCEVLGIARQTGVMGPEVADAYERGDRAGVEEHLYYDIIQTRDVFRKLYPII